MYTQLLALGSFESVQRIRLSVHLDDLVDLKGYSIVNSYSSFAGIMRNKWMNAVASYESFHGALVKGMSFPP